MRTCNKCGEEFPETAEHFYRHATNKSGLGHTCKKCITERSGRWNRDNPEQDRRNKAAWRAKYREYGNKLQRKYNWKKTREHKGAKMHWINLAERITALKSETSLSDVEKAALMTEWVNDLDIALMQGVSYPNSEAEMEQKIDMLIDAIVELGQACNKDARPADLCPESQKRILEWQLKWRAYMTNYEHQVLTGELALLKLADGTPWGQTI